MHDHNCWLMGLSFLLGLVLTFAFTVRRVTGEVPVGAGLTGGTAPEAAKIFLDDGPYGPGSAKAGTDGSGPVGWTIKGNEDSMLYHTPDSPSYGQTIAEVWFRDEKIAAAAGFARWDSRKHEGE